MPLAILPLGTANDFARTIGIPADPIGAARRLASYEVQPIDLGEVNGHLYFNVASIGFSAELAQQLSSAAKKKWGKLGYAIVAARILMRSELFTAYLEHDGMTEKFVRCRSLSGTENSTAGAWPSRRTLQWMTANWIFIA